MSHKNDGEKKRCPVKIQLDEIPNTYQAVQLQSGFRRCQVQNSILPSVAKEMLAESLQPNHDAIKQDPNARKKEEKGNRYLT